MERLEDVQREVEQMKLDAKRSMVQAFITEKMQNAKLSLKNAKKQIQADTMAKFVMEKSLGNKKRHRPFVLPSIATEVVKRCQQPASYMMFRRYHNFLPAKSPVMKEVKQPEKRSSVKANTDTKVKKLPSPE